MKLGINILLTLLILFFGYMLYNSIKEPIAFKDQKDQRSSKVVNRLKDIRTSQEMFRDINGKYASTFDILGDSLKIGKIEFENIVEDPEDPENEEKWTRIITYASAFDSIVAMGINLDSLRYIPYSKTGATFKMVADTITYQQTLVNIVEVSTRWKEFMGDYGSIRFSKYDNSYNPNNILKFGNLNKPSLSGNWEM